MRNVARLALARAPLVCGDCGLIVDKFPGRRALHCYEVEFCRVKYPVGVAYTVSQNIHSHLQRFLANTSTLFANSISSVIGAPTLKTIIGTLTIFG